MGRASKYWLSSYTPDNDVFFVSTKDGKRGYYASVREDGMGYTDIYMVTVLQDDEIQDQLASKEIDPIETAEPETNTAIEKVDTTPELTLQPVILTVNIEDMVSELPVDAKIGLKSTGDNVIVASKRESVESTRL